MLSHSFKTFFVKIRRACTAFCVDFVCCFGPAKNRVAFLLLSTLPPRGHLTLRCKQSVLVLDRRKPTASPSRHLRGVGCSKWKTQYSATVVKLITARDSRALRAQGRLRKTYAPAGLVETGRCFATSHAVLASRILGAIQHEAECFFLFWHRHWPIGRHFV